jgi:pimeloyl-ACP methyl ester carboxylesterase
MDSPRLHVEMVGEGGAPILLLPGGGVRDPAYLGDVGSWGAGRTIAVVHFPGTPLSGGVPRAWWDQHDDLEAVRRELGADPVDVLAHSSGTRVALAYAAAGGAVRRLGLITPPATWLTGGPDDVEDLARPRLGEPAIQEALTAPPLTLSDEEAFPRWQRLTAPLGYASWNDESRRHSRTGSVAVGALRVFFGAPPPTHLVEAILAVDVPVHIIGGSVDLLSGNRPVRELAGLFRNGSLEMIEGAGHYPWIDQPDAFASAIRAWAGA